MSLLINTRKLTEMLVNDYDLEKKILKTFLVTKKNLDYLEVLTEDDFYNSDNQKIYKCYREISIEEGNLDLELIPREVRSSSEFIKIITAEPLFNYELPVYVERLQKITQQRKIQHLAMEATVKVKEDKTAAEITDWLTEEFSKFITKPPEDIEKQNMRINTELLEELQKEDYFGLNTGYPMLDYRVRGFANGTLTILGGTPSVGKSTWLINIINHLCKQGKRVLHVNLEMSNLMLQMKMLSIITGLSTTLLMMTKKNFTDENWKTITDTLNILAGYKWFRIGEKEITTAIIDSTIKEQGGFDIIIVDYLQLMNPVVQKKSRYEDVSSISRGLKKISTKHNIPVVVVASINRDYAAREDKMPAMSDLRDSGNIEYDADLILFLTRRSLFEEYDEKKHQMGEFAFNHHAELLIGKNRWGFANKKIDFYFDGEKSLFREMTKEER